MSDKEEEVDNSFKNEVGEIDHLERSKLPTSSSNSILTSSSSVDTRDCNFIERITPKVLFVGSSLKVGPNQFIQKDLPVFMRQELGMVPPPESLNKGMQLEQTGLDKFRKYIELNRTYPEIKLGERVSRQLTGQKKIASVSVEIGSLQNEPKRMSSRPPVLGHASSSSNDSGSVISGSSGNESEDVPINVSAVGIDNEFVYSDVKQAVLSNREEYINVKPPEGSSDQSSLSIQMEQPPSSASSVASVSLKPLEWDSGADVGYYQNYLSNNCDDKKLSTIERIAIETGSAALLTRLEPEGTTEYFSQLANTIPSSRSLKKDHVKDRLGHPIAESTPFSTNQLKTDTPSGQIITSGSEDELSPIIAADLVTQTVLDMNADHKPNDPSRRVPPNEREKLPHPLFPEIKTRIPSSSTGSSQSSQKNKPNSSYFKPLQRINNKLTDESEHQINNLQEDEVSKCSDADFLKGILRKHFSSSMENLRDNEINPSLPTNNQFNTLPRSHSHSNICVAMPESNSLPKYLLQSHNPTKSASSSSISTVVQKRKDSPKHISKLVQTSFANQSIGVQATESKRYSDSQTSRSLSRERTQSLKASSSITGFSIQNFQYSKPSLVSPVHHHDGNICTGAHRKVFDRATSSKRNSSQSNDARASKGVSNPCSKSSNQQKGMNDGNESRIDNHDESGTLDSVTSSAKTEHHAWADRRESIGVEDRANSFEYLPGHMYETVARPDAPSGESSSISLNRNASSRNEISDEVDKSWEHSSSSTFARDIERGVDMMLNFVESSQVKSSELKKRLIKRVAEKLISADIANGCHKLDSKTPSSAGAHSLSEERLGEYRNGRETRRSLIKDIPRQESPFSSDRTSSRTSSDCFKPKSSFSSANKFMKDVHDKCVGTEMKTQSQSDSTELRRMVGSVGVQCESISSNEASKLNSEKTSSKYHENKESRDFQKQMNEPVKMRRRQPAEESRFKTPESSITIDSNRSSSIDHSTDWRPAIPIPTSAFEQKRKSQGGNTRRSKLDNGNSKAMIDLLSVERDNQRLMIQTEIEHLDYLRRLLKKQEELRDSLARIQHTRKKHLDARYNRCKTANESNKQMLNSIKKQLQQYSKSYHERNPHAKEEHQEWDSHNYSSCNDEMKNPVFERAHRNKLRDSCRISNSQSSKEGDNHTVPKFNDDSSESGEIRTPKQATDVIQQSAASQPRRSSTSSVSRQTGLKNPVCDCQKKQSCRCPRNKSSLEKNKKAVAYFITFEEESSKNNSNVGTDSSLEDLKMKSNGCHDKHSNGRSFNKKEHLSKIEKENREPKQSRKDNESRLTLQEYLLMNRGEYVNRAEYRRKCVAELTYLRELRNKTKRHLLVMAPESSDYSQSTTPRELPPPPLAMKRVFSQRTMRRQTERKYRQLAEVQNRHIDLKRKESYRTNRLMAEVFTKKLQKRVLNGETNLSNSVSVISSL